MNLTFLTLKSCNKCLILKSLDSFYRKKDGSILTPCIECKKIYAREYFNKNKNNIEYCNKRKNYCNKYYLKNKKSILEKTSKYYLNNKIYYKQYQKEYEKINPRKLRKKSPPSLKDKIRTNISRSISKSLKKNNVIKNSSIIKYLAFSIQELKDHLINKFEPWMNFNNYGKYNPKTWNDNDPSTWTWQIDHIIPHSNFKYLSMEDKEFKKCWDLNNLRPLSSKQNILQSNKRIIKKEDNNE